MRWADAPCRVYLVAVGLYYQVKDTNLKYKVQAIFIISSTYVYLVYDYAARLYTKTVSAGYMPL